jgi:hypothetical protein
LCS